MPWFIKTEQFTKETLTLTPEERQSFLAKHKSWIIHLKGLGQTVYSGYLVDSKGIPGGGGLLILKANSYEEAISLIKSDPMIIHNLVTWKLQEWIPVGGALSS